MAFDIQASQAVFIEGYFAHPLVTEVGFKLDLDVPLARQVSWAVFHIALVPVFVHDSFNVRSILVKRPSKGKHAPLEGHDAFMSEAWRSALNSALLSPTNKLQPPLLVQRRDATMDAMSAVWIMYVS